MRVYSKTVNTYNVLNKVNGLGSLHSPHVGWDPVKDAKSYAISLIDHEANGVVGMSFIHWIAFNIHNDHICRNSSISKKNKIVQFENSLSKKVRKTILDDKYLMDNANCYYGPCPPDQDHTYELRVYALDFEDVNEIIDTSVPRFWNDFEDVIANHVIDEGVLTFSSEQALETNDGKLYSEESQTHGMFYFLNDDEEVDKLKVSIPALEMHETEKIKYLPKKYYVDVETLKTDVKTNSPLIKIKNIKKVKEYAIFVFNSSTAQEWGLVSCEFACLGIKPQQGDWTIIKENDLNNSDDDRTARHLIPNSFKSNSVMPEDIKKHFVNRQDKWNVFKNKKSSVKNKFHWMVVYALDQNITERFKVKTVADAYRIIKNKVIAEKIIKFKLK
ncbi:YbhB/YbcL family Raf kinase inhibitor-like protein [[Mycoplasma] gypis]|uniref:YbhB/YbcL family Raf kinase inhibitor-like protein n=1 Tax=[Mycoplasma] gypis TaxID=92404 RepID=A0ABZ2RNR8_9BACT|nr:YbhB/YbcL family Raf kinase inhibitor-like protein [[Mycoplasma] gypis]MBN0919285.1 YbhB/YbcL family Raf kinase inhibitor-like protein [[Mycoplasma] gypis]